MVTCFRLNLFFSILDLYKLLSLENLNYGIEQNEKEIIGDILSILYSNDIKTW